MFMCGLLLLGATSWLYPFSCSAASDAVASSADSRWLVRGASRLAYGAQYRKCAGKICSVTVHACHPMLGAAWLVGAPHMRLRGGVKDGLMIMPLSDQSISVSGSDSGRYWEENFNLPDELKGVKLPGPRDIRNISDVLGDYIRRASGDKVWPTHCACKRAPHKTDRCRD